MFKLFDPNSERFAKCDAFFLLAHFPLCVLKALGLLLSKTFEIMEKLHISKVFL